MQQTDKSGIIHDQGQQGIALIVVLGVLTIMTLLAVSFAITMRTERLAAENYVYGVQARHLLNEALAQALFEADDYLGGTNPMMYPDFSKSGPPLTDVFVSVGGSEGPRDFLYGEVESFVPLSVWDETVSAADTHVKWNNIEDPSTGDTIGRFAYLVLNCSGLLDANYAGGQTRGTGTNAAEISIAQMSDVSDEAKFLSERKDKWVRFETLPEMLEVEGLSKTFQNLFTYSRFAVPTNLIYIGGTPADLQAKETEIKKAFSDCKISDSDGLFKNLIDYVDNNSEPTDLNSFCTEPVPMINEVLVTGAVTRTALDTWTLDLRIEVETWYPFRGSGPNFRLKPGPSVSFPIAQPSWLKPDAATMTAPAPVSGYPEFSFQTSVYRFNNVSYTTNTVPGTRHGFQMDLGALELEALGAGIVDRTPAMPRFTFQLGNINAIPVGEAKSINVAKTVVDPRINWDASHWMDDVGSIGALNPGSVGVGEGVSPMYVRNGPLQSVAELGFLSIGEPWRTVTLCKTNSSVQLHPVLDYFTLETNVMKKGLVNINTRRSEVLAAALFKAPVDEYPGEPAPTLAPITWSNAQQYADSIIKYTKANSITNLSQMGEIEDLFQTTPKLLQTDAQREAIIRNNIGLLSPRQNLFTVILAAQVYDGSAVFAEQRAVAVVWRDPVADSTGRHPTFVRFFKLLAE